MAMFMFMSLDQQGMSSKKSLPEAMQGLSLDNGKGSCVGVYHDGFEQDRSKHDDFVRNEFRCTSFLQNGFKNNESKIYALKQDSFRYDGTYDYGFNLGSFELGHSKHDDFVHHGFDQISFNPKAIGSQITNHPQLNTISPPFAIPVRIKPKNPKLDTASSVLVLPVRGRYKVSKSYSAGHTFVLPVGGRHKTDIDSTIENSANQYSDTVGPDPPGSKEILNAKIKPKPEPNIIPILTLEERKKQRKQSARKRIDDKKEWIWERAELLGPLQEQLLQEALMNNS